MAAGMALSRAVKLHQIQCVVAAARRGSFRRAAEALNVQQSSVSRSVQELEGRLGAPLFRRSPCGVEVTEAGARFLVDAEAALDQLGRAAHMAGVASERERDTVRIGTVALPGSGFLPELLQAFMTGRTGHRVVLHEAPSDETLLALHAGSLDLAIVLKAPKGGLGAEVTPLWCERWLLGAAGPAARNSSAPLAWEELDLEGLILPACEIGEFLIHRLASATGGRFLGPMCRAGPATALGLAAVGQGRAVLPASARHLAPPGIVFRPIADEGLTVSAVRMVRNEKPALRRLMILLRERVFRSSETVGGGEVSGAVPAARVRG